MDQVSHLVDFLQTSWKETEQSLDEIGPSPRSLLRHLLFSLPSSASPSPFSPSSASSFHSSTLSFATLFAHANSQIASYPYSSVPLSCLRFYTEVGIVWTVHDLLLRPSPRSSSSLSSPCDGSRDGRATEDEFWEGVVARLDMVIIVAGAVGEGRRELVDDLIDFTQTTYLPFPSSISTPSNSPSASSEPYPSSFNIVPLPKKRRRSSSPSPSSSIPPAAPENTLLLSPNPILSLQFPPSLSTYLTSDLLRTPFIIRNHLKATSWPALSPPPSPSSSSSTTSRWSDRDYLERIAGRGRIVPVEVGGQYTESGWGQSILPWAEVLKRVGFKASSPTPSSLSSTLDDSKHRADYPRGEREEEDEEEKDLPPLYLAQHNLLSQFPKLRNDILLPDYVFSSPPVVKGEEYAPPNNDEGVLINVWIGGEGRRSPAHTDPYYNCYAQVVNRKRIFLVPPSQASNMYLYSASSSSSGPTTSNSATSSAPLSPPPSTEGESEDAPSSSFFTNTSSLPIFPPNDAPPSRDLFPKFYEHALPSSVEGVLEPGDMLVMPPGWFHSFRQEGAQCVQPSAVPLKKDQRASAGFGVSFWY